MQPKQRYRYRDIFQKKQETKNMQVILKKLPVALTLALAFGSAMADPAVDTPGFHGYGRVGAGTSSRHGPQSCFSLGGNTMKYRLGNECDAYFEGGYTNDFATVDGITYTGTLWGAAYKPNSDFGDADVTLAKAYVEAKGIPFLNGGTAWIGKRYYMRPDIHMLDLQYLNLNGTGGGVDRVKMGDGFFSYAIFKDNDFNDIQPVTGVVTNTPAAIRQNFIYQGLPVNTDGVIDVAASVISAQGNADRHDGWQLSAFHRQAKVWGGGNTFGIQYGVGPGTGIGVGNDRIGASGSTLLGSDVKRWRVFNDLAIQPTTNFGMEFVALVQRDQSDVGSSTWTTLGVRPAYALNRYIKLQMELGTDRVTSPTGGPAQRLTKITFAPTISAGPGLFDRPELRFFVTYGKWNDAATAAVNAANNSGPVYNNNTSGASAGLQVETWF
jgi:maltoporin